MRGRKGARGMRNLRREMAAKLLEEGMPKAEIARQLGISHSTIHAWLPPTGATERKDDLRVQAQALRASGMNNAAIGREMGLSRQRVSQILGPMLEDDEPWDTKLVVPVRRSTGADLRRIARRLGYVTTRGPEVNNGSLAKFFDALARGDLVVMPAAEAPPAAEPARAPRSRKG